MFRQINEKEVILMNEKQELALALERFAKACQNDYVNEAVNKTAVNLKKNENVAQEAKWAYQRLNQVMLAEHLKLNDEAKEALATIKKIAGSDGAFGGLNTLNATNVW